jgi:hypothetical protein
MNRTQLTTLFLVLTITSHIKAQPSSQPKYRICMDIAHGEKFWHDPASMEGKHPDFVARVKYMTGQFIKTASSVNAELVYLKSEINPDQLIKCSLLFIHIPSAKYTPGEVNAITNYVINGGSLFLVMDQDYWSTLEQTNVNDLIRSVGIQFGGQNPDTLAGGSTHKGLITKKALKISYHGARIVNGGTPFCFNDRSEEFPFGTFTQLKNGGKAIVMGDGMVSLYMTEWEGVKGYQCQEFMHDVFQWLLEK